MTWQLAAIILLVLFVTTIALLFATRWRRLLPR